MYGKRNLVLAIVWIVLGAVFLVFSLKGVLNDPFSPYGSAFLLVGILRLIRYFRYKNDPEYRKRVDTAYSDERYAFIKGKAMAWTFYISIIGMTAAVIVLQLIGKGDAAAILGYIICAQVIIYMVSFRIVAGNN